MKTTRFVRFILLSSALFIISCNKGGDKTENQNPEIATHTEDQNRVTAELDAVANDANLAIESSVALSGRLQNIQGVICDASVTVDLISDPMKLTVVYDGTNCLGNRTRTGTIVLSMAQGTQWKNAGAEITLEYQDFKVTRISDNKSITFNGTVKMQNVSGGLVMNLSSGGTITHTITSNNLSLTFDNGAQRNWNIARERQFTYAGGVNVSVSGTQTVGTESGVAEWGTNRFGQNFTTSTIQPLVFRQDCNFRLTSGSVKHTTPNFSAMVDFGLNSSGTPVSCPAGNYYFMISWTGPNNDTIRIIRPY